MSLPSDVEKAQQVSSLNFARFSLSEYVRRRVPLLGSRIFQAASLSMVAYLFSQMIRFGGNLAITRILVPEMFGLMAIVFSVQVTIALLSDIGVRTSIIQNHRDDPEFLNTAWSIQVLRGIGICLTGIAVAIGLAIAGHLGYLPKGSAWAEPQLPLVLAATSFGSIIVGLQSTNYVTASRNLQLKRLIVIDGAAQVAGLIVMIVAGALTRSIWALVGTALVSSLLQTVLSHTSLPGISNRFGWNERARREIYKFGIWILASSITFVLASNVDRILLGGLVSGTTLGIYSIALNLVMIVDNAASRLYEHVVLPALSRIAREEPQDFRRSLHRLRLPFDLGYLAAAGCIFATGPTLINILYDPRYESAGTMLQILSLSLVFSRFGILPIAYVALGRPQLQAITNAVKLVSAVLLMLVLYHFFGFNGALYGVALHSAAALPLYYWFNRSRGLNDLAFELIVLPAWPLGYLAGEAFVQIVRVIAG